jgi:hypothetical protein
MGTTKKEKRELKKGFVELDAVCDKFNQRDDTLLAISCIGDTCGVSFTGDAYKVSLAMAEILKGGLEDESNKTEFELMSAFTFAIRVIANRGDIVGKRFRSILELALKDDLAQEIKKLKEENDSTKGDDFDADDDDCQDCDDFVECATRILIDGFKDIIKEREERIEKQKQTNKPMGKKHKRN